MRPPAARRRASAAGGDHDADAAVPAASGRVHRCRQRRRRRPEPRRCQCAADCTADRCRLLGAAAAARLRPPPATTTPPAAADNAARRGTACGVPPRDPNVAPSGAAAIPPVPAAQVTITAPQELRTAGGPYTVPLSVANASRLSMVTLTVTFNPAVLRVRNVQEGTFMRQGGVTATFTPRIDIASGRVDIAVARNGDQAGASGSGLLAALLFDAVGPGNSLIQVSGVASNPEGGALAAAVSRRYR